MSKAQEFAEKYLGRRIVISSSQPKSKFGIVSGYKNKSDFIIYEPLTEGVGYRVKGSDRYVFLRKVKRYFVADVNNFRKTFNLDTPEDCLDCGARGEQECKPSCPNREK
jgi:hypothetical protein